jgi:RNA polymerase subunit RPABC4/transcription elongation factor Spt4
MDQLPIEPLIKIGYVELLAECPRCHMLVKHGVVSCESCRAALPPARPDSKIFIAVRGERKVAPNERATPFVECPNCHKLLEMGAEMCPECREEIDPAYALSNAVARVLTAQASNSAEAVESTKLITVAVALLSASALAFGWSSRQDEDFLRARRTMKSVLRIWLGLLAAQLLVVVLRLSGRL